MKIPILFEDNHLLLVEKPINIPVQEDSSGDLDLLTMLKNDIVPEIPHQQDTQKNSSQEILQSIK